jgi:ABC-type multidrug transport system fused ATPase/permease subunit
MGKLLRYGGWALLALVALWVVVEVVTFLFGVLSWLVSTVVSLALLALLLYAAYLLVSKFFAGRGGGRSQSRSQSREREKIFE